MQAKVMSLNAAARDLPLRQNLRGLAAYLEDPTLTELCVNQYGKIWLERAEGWQLLDEPALSPERVRDLTQLIATYSGKVCTEQEPHLSGSLPDGERVQIVIPPGVEPGKISITIRKPSAMMIQPSQYEARGLHENVPDYSLDGIDPGALKRFQKVDRELLELRAARKFWEMYELAVREHRNIIIAGATGSGKTTLLKTLVNFIPPHERIITIEDTREITVPHANAVHLLYGGDITPTQCMKSCMRMKPDRILPGELRDEAAYDFIQTVTSGHPGALTTIHGGSKWAAFSRLGSLVAQCDQGRTMAATGMLERVLNSEIHLVIVVAASYQFDESKGTGRTVRRVVEIGCNADPRESR
jgi:type IV secretion system protein VirB11